MNCFALLFAIVIGSTAALPANVIERVERIHSVLVQRNVTYDDNLNWRVVGGSTAGNGQFPYIASLRSGNSHFCGGTVVSNVYIISAAHCTVGASPSQIGIVVGTNILSSGGTRHGLSRIVNNPNYISNTHANDISILRTSSIISYSNFVQSIPISPSVLGAGATVTLSGWGSLIAEGSIPNNLQFINLRTLSVQECQQRLGANEVFSSSLCTLNGSGQGACNGDSGGPLVYNNILVGAVSWGVPCAVGYPDVFTRISSFHNWILANAP